MLGGQVRARPDHFCDGTSIEGAYMPPPAPARWPFKGSWIRVPSTFADLYESCSIIEALQLVPCLFVHGPPFLGHPITGNLRSSDIPPDA